MSDPAVRATGIFESLPEDRLRAVRSRSTTRSRALDAAKEEARQAAYAEAFELGQIAGYAEGVEKGHREATTKFTAELDGKLQEIVSELKTTLGELTVAVEHFYQDAERQLAKLAKEVVTRVLDAELKSNDEAILGIVKGALTEVAQSRDVVVRVNTANKQILDEHRENILRSFAGIKSLEVISDPTIDAGCIVESSHGSVDASRSTTLRLIEGEAA